MSTSTQTFNWESRDLLEELEARAGQYYEENGVAPDAVFLSTDLFANMLVQMMEVSKGPTLHVTSVYRYFEVVTSYGTLSVRELDKYGSDFLFVGRKIDIFPEEGEASLPEKLLLGDV